jgi:hypothetical protein
MAVGRFFTFGLCALAFASPGAFANDEIFVSNYYGNFIHVYPRTANGDVAPSRTIFGLSQPHDLGIDLVHRELFVPNNLPSVFAPQVTVFDLDAGTPGPGDTPKRVIAGAATLLDRPAALLVDSVHGELYVANDVDPADAAILVFALGASGNAAPVRILKGAQTGLGGPIGMALDLVHNELVVVNYKVTAGGSITVYPRTFQGNVAPLRTIQGSLTGFNRPQALALDLAHNELLLANSFFDNTISLGEILVFPRTGSGNIASTRKITGPNTGLCNPIGMTFDRVHDELVITNAAVNIVCDPSVVVHARAGTGNVAPVRAIGPGPASDLNSPEGAAVATTVDCADPLVADGTPCSPDPCTTGGVCTNDVCQNGTPLTVPGEVQSMAASPDRETYSWSATANATRYDVVRGVLAGLPAGPGDEDEVCFANVSGTSFSDPTVPDTNSGFWYLARGENACGAGTYGTESIGSPRVTGTCP